MTQTRNLMMHPTWAAQGDGFHYKLSVEGGFQFFRDTVARAKPELAFDHDVVATALSQASGESIDALSLPFDRFRYTDEESHIQFYYAGTSWQCRLDQPECTELERRTRPKAFGVVRDLREPAYNEPQASPDASYNAYV
ncbi:S9 family peptidase, partial [Thalassospira xiamenensis]